MGEWERDRSDGSEESGAHGQESLDYIRSDPTQRRKNEKVTDVCEEG